MWRIVTLIVMLAACGAVRAADGPYPKGLSQTPEFFPLAVWLQAPANAARYRAIGINTYVGLWGGPTEEQLEAGRQLGAEVAKDLVEEIQDMGLPAVRAAELPRGETGDIVIRGTFLSVDEGSALKRIVVGFGSGGAELRTLVEGYVMTERGLRKLGSGQIDSGGNKLPGVVLPLAVFVATANPIGLAVGGAVKATGELTGSSTIEGSGRRTAELIAQELKVKFEEQGWIE